MTNMQMVAVFRNVMAALCHDSDNHKELSGNATATQNFVSETTGTYARPKASASRKIILRTLSASTDASEGAGQCARKDMAASTWHVPFKSLGAYQPQNVAVAMTAMHVLKAHLPLAGSEEDSLMAMAQVRTLCKCDLYTVWWAGQSVFASPYVTQLLPMWRVWPLGGSSSR
jgi:hypothetical protein